MKILIVEDEPLIAFDLKDMLEEAGFEVVGLAGSVSEGLALVETCGCDFALLDVNLRGAHSGPIAEALTARGVRFVAISGYAPDQIPAPLKHARFLPKPVRAQDLLDILRAR